MIGRQVLRVATRASSRLSCQQCKSSSLLIARYSTASEALKMPATKITSSHSRAQVVETPNDDLYTAKPPKIEYLMSKEEKFELKNVAQEIIDAELNCLPENAEKELFYQYDCWWFNDMLNIRKLTIEQAEKLIALAKKQDQFELHMYGQLMHVYSRNGNVDGVRSVAKQYEEEGGELDEGYYRDLMYAHYVNGKYDLAHATYVEMINEGFRPQYSGYCIELSVLEKLGKTELIPPIIEDIRKDGHVVPKKYQTEADKPILDI
eukprot:Phypoly_transcript_14304.p1 GENE.Phypoly_transcript_14304~~Phypoly_transcript_14304.p1  ORF type:complete len:263 (+),score=58.16 Phypoly_transcript_14304:175-963(+)